MHHNHLSSAKKPQHFFTIQPQIQPRISEKPYVPTLFPLLDRGSIPLSSTNWNAYSILDTCPNTVGIVFFMRLYYQQNMLLLLHSV